VAIIANENHLQQEGWTDGIYRLVRNPLALSTDLLALGVLLLAPSWLALPRLIAT
jgi:protein-S-isoprenylcysteine O-methyltransferase Ste14